MKPTGITVGACVLALAAVAGWALGGIEGSKHDFSKKEWAGGNACGVCHGASSEEPPTAAPLWDENADLNRTFGTPLEQSERAGLGTTVCLRCHDGTIARDTLGGAKHEGFVNTDHPGMHAAGHRTSEHPVGVDYPNFDKGYRPVPSVVASGTVQLPDGKVECISCHDPHNMSGQPHMLVASNTRSALCLTCHRK